MSGFYPRSHDELAVRNRTHLSSFFEIIYKIISFTVYSHSLSVKGNVMNKSQWIDYSKMCSRHQIESLKWQILLNCNIHCIWAYDS